MRFFLHVLILKISLFIAFDCAISVAAQYERKVYSEEAEVAFGDGISLYEEGLFDEALNQFSHVLARDENQRSSAAEFMQGKCYYKLGDFDLALEVFRGLESNYPSSKYISESELQIGEIFFKKKRYFEAAERFGRLLGLSFPISLQAQAAEHLAAIILNKQISVQAKQRIRLSVGSTRMDEAILFGTARWYGRLGWLREAERAKTAYMSEVGIGGFLFSHKQLLDYTKTSDFYSEFVELENVIDSNVSLVDGNELIVPKGTNDRKIKIGLLLPLSGSFARIAEEIYNGVNLANIAAGEPFTIIVEDFGESYGDLPINDGFNSQLEENVGSGLLRVTQGARKLVHQEVVAIIGPLFSSSCVAAAIVAEAAKVPLLAPLSQQSGLDSLGEFVFQINSVPELQGRMLGEHASLVLGLENLVVVSPLTDYGWNFEREFRRTAEENGGSIVKTDWYVPSETKDFRRIFEEVREIGFSLMPSTEDTLSAADSLRMIGIEAYGDAPNILMDFFDELQYQEALADSLNSTTELDSTEIFINSIHGIVIVVENFSDVKTIAPQLAFHRLNTQVLGNSLWFDREGLRQMRRSERKYLEGAIITSTHQENSEIARNFVDDYRYYYEVDPGYAAYGFDAARLLIDAYSKIESDDPVLIRNQLASVENFTGASGRISFEAPRRVNGALSLVKLEKDKYKILSHNDLPDFYSHTKMLPSLD